MLVLSRRPDSSILVGHDVKVTVEVVSGDDVCLRVTGPEDLRVERLDEIQVAKQLATRGKVWDDQSMHVLSRRSRPGLLIDGEVVIAVQTINNDSIRIGIEAPPHVMIYREEVYEQMQEANRGAMSDGASDLAGLAGIAGHMPDRPPGPP